MVAGQVTHRFALEWRVVERGYAGGDAGQWRRLADAAKRLSSGGQTALAAECEDVLQRADAFILAYDNCAPIRPNFIYDSRRLVAEQIDKALVVLKETERK